MNQDLKVFKRLCAHTNLSLTNNSKFYKLEELSNYLASDSWADIYSESYMEDQSDFYTSALTQLTHNGLPTKKHKVFGDFNLSKLYNTDILDTSDVGNSVDYYNMQLTRFDRVATGHKETVIFCDSNAFTTNDLHEKNTKVRLFDDINKNYKYNKYTTYLENTKGFGDLTIASTVFPNVLTINKSNDTPVVVEYCNSVDDPIVESNTNIIDIKADSRVNINELVNLQAGQLNYVVYILRENATLNLQRETVSKGGTWSIFDSVFICYPGSTLNIDVRSPGSHYSIENFYVEATKDVTVNINGRNNIRKGNEYHSEVFFETKSTNNSCDIDIRTVGNEHTNTSFVGTFLVDKQGTGFSGNMFNKNIMLDSSSTMRSRPQLDIKTKEIDCAHGCTISNVDDSALYYLQTKGVSMEQAKTILVDSFLC